jgi:hypothetical protein
MLPSKNKIDGNMLREGGHWVAPREATVGFEPTVGVLQTPALLLGYVAGKNRPVSGALCRAGEGIRTLDLLLGKETFYH